MKCKLWHILLIFLIIAYGEMQCQVVISQGSALTITSGGSVYMGTDLELQSGTSGSGYLADQNSNGECTVTGNVLVKRYLTANGWHNVSSPVSTGNTSLFSGTDLIFYYDETIIENDWNFGWVMYEGAMNVFRGYDVYLNFNQTISYTGNTSSQLNSGSYSINVYKTDPANGEIESHKGWNLIGNPYPSPVDWQEESGWDKTIINNAKYIWDPSTNNYTIWLGGSNPSGLNGGTQYIPSNQGFWVQATTNGSISINNTCRVGQASATPDYYKNINVDYPSALFEVNGNGYTDECMLRFLPEATDGFDRGLDASKLFSPESEVPQIYFHLNQQFYSIHTSQTVYDGFATELNFKCGRGGYYTIKLKKKTEVLTNNDLVILDKITGEYSVIDETAEFTFSHNTTNRRDRFIVFINPTDNQLLPNSNNFVSLYVTNGYLSIVNQTGSAMLGILCVHNVLGQVVISKQIAVEEKVDVLLPLKSGYYIVSFASGNKKTHSKILLGK